MNRDIGNLAGPVLALVLLAIVVWQTLGSLREAGAWVRSGHRPGAAIEDPLVALDRVIGAPRPDLADSALRDPFGLTPVAVAVRPHAVVRHVVVPPPPPPAPVLTAIVWDADPRALVRWNGREWTVHTGASFDVFQVVSITRTQVILKHGDESVVLTQKPQGE